MRSSEKYIRELTKALIEDNINSYGNSIEKEKNKSVSKEKLIKENRKNSIEEIIQIDFKIPNLNIKKNSNKDLDNLLNRKIQRGNSLDEREKIKINTKGY
jgi:hypothetical protein